MTIEYWDKTCKTNRSPSKLHALEKKHGEAGNIAKADRIRHNDCASKTICAHKTRLKRGTRYIFSGSFGHSASNGSPVIVQPLGTFSLASSQGCNNTLTDSTEADIAQNPANNTLEVGLPS
ncbi:MAG: hypothetical protein HKL81_02755 [Acidimicrobiaceae bacterium]|nr:hypothetical protein [Acidimicrobiaceae bacterium]